MTRTYRCTNRDCPQFGVEQTVSARPLGIFWEYPTVVCECGCEPWITRVNGQSTGEQPHE